MESQGKGGHLNGPPYPLSRSDYSASEKKADDKSGDRSKKSGLSSTQKKVLIGVGITAASVLVIYGGYKLYKAYSASNNDTFANDFIDGFSKTKVSDITGFENKKKVTVPQDSKMLLIGEIFILYRIQCKEILQLMIIQSIKQQVKLRNLIFLMR